MQALIVIILFAVIASLGQALFSMSSPHSNSKAMVNALTVRIGLSVALFALLFVGWHFWLDRTAPSTPLRKQPSRYS